MAMESAPKSFSFWAYSKKPSRRMHGRYGVRDSALEPAAARLNSLGVVDDVANVVQSVEHAEHLNAVFFSRMR